MVDSRSLIKSTNAENIYNEEGKITGTRIEMDTTKATQYIQTKKTKISGRYEIVKSYTNKLNENYYDAIFVLAIFNEFLEYTTGNPIEDRCIYVKMIPTEKRAKLSNRVLDEILGSYIYTKETKKDWYAMNYDLKYDYIFTLLNSPTKQGRKCLEGFDDFSERTKVFPPDARTE